MSETTWVVKYGKSKTAAKLFSHWVCRSCQNRRIIRQASYCNVWPDPNKSHGLGPVSIQNTMARENGVEYLTGRCIVECNKYQERKDNGPVPEW